MKNVTINSNWIKIRDLIEKDSVILVSEGSEVNITDNINADMVKFSKYKNWKALKHGKKVNYG